METQMIDYSKKCIVSEIERYALNDGPGIRTVIFLKGCPLKCKWCANPENMTPTKKIMYSATKCIGCKKCVSSCPEHAISWSDTEGHMIDRSKCTLCGICADNCYSDALSISGKEMTVAEVMDEVKKDIIFYRTSEGGITFSGGEAMLHPDFVIEVCKAAHELGISTCIETAGYVNFSSFEKVLGHIDLFLYDLKAMNDETHRKYIGVSNELILENFVKLYRNGAKVWARMPIIPHVNADMDHIDAVIGFLRSNDISVPVSLLPYHRLGVSKYDRLGMDYEIDRDIEPPEESVLQKMADRLRNSGFEVSIRE